LVSADGLSIVRFRRFDGNPMSFRAFSRSIPGLLFPDGSLDSLT
jgi:hypothetical protein